MRRTAILAAVLVLGVACGPDGPDDPGDPSTTTAAPAAGFPVTVTDDAGPVTIGARPAAIVSLSASATEMLYAVGAGPQVVAVDDQSDYPEDAPTTELSGFTPNVEAILAYNPDLVILAFDPADNPVSEALGSVGVPVLFLDAAATIDDVYRQIRVIGLATGHPTEASAVMDEVREGLESLIFEFGDSASGVTYYHELDSTLFTVTSQTFIGEIYGLLRMENIADAADEDGSSFGYPQLSSEYVVTADPDIVFLADSEFGESLETLGTRPGWGGMTAIVDGAVVPLDTDISSRWGPRIVDFLRAIGEATAEHTGE